LRIVASRGFNRAFLDFFAVVPDGDHSASGAALKQANRIIVPDIAQSPIFFANQSGAVLREAGVLSVQSTPLVARDGSLFGMVSTHWRHVSAPSDEAMKQLDKVIDRVIGGIEAASGDVADAASQTALSAEKKRAATSG
jgi:hypothetical protein